MKKVLALPERKFLNEVRPETLINVAQDNIDCLYCAPESNIFYIRLLDNPENIYLTSLEYKQIEVMIKHKKPLWMGDIKYASIEFDDSAIIVDHRFDNVYRVRFNEYVSLFQVLPEEDYRGTVKLVHKTAVDLVIEMIVDEINRLKKDTLKKKENIKYTMELFGLNEDDVKKIMEDQDADIQ